MRQGAAAFAAQIAVLKPAGQNLVETGTGDDSELTDTRDGLSQTPVRNAHAHAALNDFWKRNMHVKLT